MSTKIAKSCTTIHVVVSQHSKVNGFCQEISNNQSGENDIYWIVARTKLKALLMNIITNFAN